MTEPTGPIVTSTVATPVGELRVAADGDAVIAVAFADHFDRMTAPIRRRWPERLWQEGESPAADAVARYVGGELDALDGIAVAAVGTEFQTRVWEALRRIPVGETRSYADVARAIGAPAAVRAVGTANGANPVWVVVPCHRVVRSDGTLGGYGGGVDRKAWLLEHEGARS